MEYSNIDLVLGGFLVFGALKGARKGLIIEITSLLGLIVGVWGAISFSYYMGNILHLYFNLDEKYISLLSFIITFIGIVFAISIIGKTITKIISTIALGWLNRLLGAIFGLSKFAFIFSIILTIILQINNKIEFISKETIENSILFEPVASFAPAIMPMLSGEKMDHLWDDTYDKIEEKILSDLF